MRTLYRLWQDECNDLSEELYVKVVYSELC